MLNHLSVSAVTTYQSCPKMFYLQYVLKVMQFPSKALEIGKFVHSGIEMFNQKKDWESILKKEILSKLNDENVEVFRIVRRIIKTYERNPVEGNTVANELKCEFPLINSKGEQIPLPFLGFIDRVIDRGIVEYKTSAEDYTQEQIDTSLQATIYSYFYGKKYGELPKDIIYWVANKKKVMKEDEYVPQILTTCRTQNDIDNAFDEVKDVYNNIMAEKFEIGKENHPFWCNCNKYNNLIPNKKI